MARRRVAPGLSVPLARSRGRRSAAERERARQRAAPAVLQWALFLLVFAAGGGVPRLRRRVIDYANWAAPNFRYVHVEAAPVVYATTAAAPSALDQHSAAVTICVRRRIRGARDGEVYKAAR